MRRISIIAVLGLLALQAIGGQLDDIEKKGKKEKSNSSSNLQPKPQSSGSSSSDFGSGTYPSSSSRNNFAGDFLIWLITAPFQSWNSDAAPSESDAYDGEEKEWADGGSGLFSGHDVGVLTIPYLRADYHWQYINSNLNAQDIRIEAGYKMLALYGRHTRYIERNPTDELTVNQYYGMLRFGGALHHENFLTGSWEIGLGLGGAKQIGNEEHSSWAFTVPLKFYPTDWFGVEFRPSWYRPQDRMIGDYDLSASLGYRFVQLRGGYRWRWMQGEGHMLNGPYAGLSISF